MPQSLAFFRGQIVPIEDAQVSVMTHALHYGTAVFEGIRGNWNEDEGKLFVFRMREHYVRLLQGCRMMLMDIPYSADHLCSVTVNLLQSCGYREDLYIRPLAYKSQELVANLKLQELDSDFTLMAVPFGNYIDAEGAIHCTTSSWRRIDDTIIPPRVKISGHYVNSILAKTEATLAGFDEAIMLTQGGDVSEGSGENLFLITNGAIFTPPVADNNLTGITRDSAMTLAREELGIEVVERQHSQERALPGRRGVPDGHGGAYHPCRIAGQASDRRRRGRADHPEDTRCLRRSHQGWKSQVPPLVYRDPDGLDVHLRHRLLHRRLYIRHGCPPACRFLSADSKAC